jgi:uncharacterized membrane protein YeaQ/YmgE (transglycosylase-associated protein family)
MTINLNFGQIIVWIVIGAVVGWLVAKFAKRNIRGLGKWGNEIAGIIGGVLGGLIFGLLGIRLDLGGITITISFVDVVFAAIGALLAIGAVIFIQTRR